MERLLLREKPSRAILAIGEMDRAYAAMVAKQIDSTFPHTSSILSQLEECGLIKSRPEGRIRYLELTDRGKKVAYTLRNLIELLNEPGAQWRHVDAIRQAINLGHGQDSALKLGPLRRDLAKFKFSGDAGLVTVAEELDRQIISAIKR
ncbi:MAG: winged helix-turn-helix domain-containing protein [Methanotrichaceae archaeon]